MTQLRHVAWYLMIIASTYAANDKYESSMVFFVGSVVIYAISFFERKR